MASNYERIDVIESLHGDVIWVGVRGSRVVLNVYGSSEVFLDAAGQEKFAQAYVAACHKANANAAQAAPPSVPADGMNPVERAARELFGIPGQL